MITESQLIERIRIVAATEPDFVYQCAGACNYLPNQHNCCGCIVGEALIDLGVDRSLLQVLDDWAPQGIAVSWGSNPVLSLFNGILEPKALVSPWVRRVQAAQDDYQTWGEAIRNADECADDLGWVKA